MVSNRGSSSDTIRLKVYDLTSSVQAANDTCSISASGNWTECSVSWQRNFSLAHEYKFTLSRDSGGPMMWVDAVRADGNIESCPASGACT